MRLFLPVALFIFCLVSAFAAEPETHELFTKDGKFAENYDNLIEWGGLQPGNEIVFGNGKRFTFHGFLGKGKTTALLDVGNGVALRVPLHKGKLINFLNPDPLPVRAYLKKFLDGHEELNGLDIPRVGVFAEESFADQYVVVQKLDVQFTLEELLLKKGMAAKLTGAERAKAFDAVVDFGARLWQLTYLGDLHPGQIGFVDGKCVLFDWTEGSHRWSPSEDRGGENPFWWMGGELGLPRALQLPDEILNRITEKVEAARNQYRAAHPVPRANPAECRGSVRGLLTGGSTR